MKLKLAHATSVFVVLFTLSFTAYACENSPAAKTTVDPVNVDPVVIAMADKILAEQAEADVSTVNDDFRIASNPPDSLLSTASRAASISKWLEDRAVQTTGAAESKTQAHSAAKNSHAHFQDIEVDMGGGWCDLCGCWLNHGRDPNGTPQSEIGHQEVCKGGATSENCWKHFYRYCFSS
jgi:hypothetical protein